MPSADPFHSSDPSALTTAQLLREITILKELMVARLQAIEARFALLESSRVEQKTDTKNALDAALAAAKEAVREQTIASDKAFQKNEQSTKEALNQLTNTFDRANAITQENMNELKDRVTRAEALKQGGQEKLTGLYAGLSGIGLLIVLANAVVAYNSK